VLTHKRPTFNVRRSAFLQIVIVLVIDAFHCAGTIKTSNDQPDNEHDDEHDNDG
jgi:hypothetical protein